MTRSADDFTTIRDRVKAIAGERSAAITGCTCSHRPRKDPNNHNHWSDCPLFEWPSAEALAIMAAHHRAVTVRHKLWTGPEPYTQGMSGCAVDCPHPDHQHDEPGCNRAGVA